MRWRLVLAILVIVAGAPVPTAAAPAQDVSTDGCIQHDRHHSRMETDDTEPVVTISRTVDDSVVRYTFNGTGGAPQFGVSLPEGTLVVDSSGFNGDSEGLERDYNAQNPWIEVHYGNPVPNMTYPTTAGSFVVELPDSSDADLQFTTNRSGYVGSHFALLGEYGIGTSHAGCQQIQVVMPAGLAQTEPADHYASKLAIAATSLDIGPRYTVVTAFVLPGDSGGRDGFTPKDGDIFASEFVVSTDASFTNPRNTWVHEYIHTRQAIAPEWVTEGSAMYFTTKTSVEQGWISSFGADAFYRSMANSSGHASPKHPENVPYTIGAFFFSELSERLSGTNSTVESVYRLVNTEAYRNARGAHALEDINAERFGAAVESQTGLQLALQAPYSSNPQVSYNNPRWFVNATAPTFSALRQLPLPFLSLVYVFVVCLACTRQNRF